MQWLDMHCDTLSELGEGEHLFRNKRCVDLCRLRESGAKAQFFACFVNAAEYGNLERRKTWDEAYEKVQRIISRAESETGENFRILKRPGDLADMKKERIYGILTLEEGGVLNGEAQRLDWLYDRGIRLITLTWNHENCIGSPNSTDPAGMKRGLKPFGTEVVERMNRKGMIVDVSHLSDGGFWDCIRYSRFPVVASHSNARAICPHPRNLSDEMLHALGEKGGVAGVNFYGKFLRETTPLLGKKDMPDEKLPAGNGRDPQSGRIPDVSDLVRHICWIINKAGEDAAALGTDFDGCERNSLPKEIRGVQDMDILWEAMKKEGITWRQIEKIAYGNVRRVLREVLRQEK